MSYCGLVCSSCPIYLATREEDIEKKSRMKVEIAQRCNEEYGTEYEPDGISDCDGCLADEGRLFSGSIECKIRKCAKSKGFQNCALCGDYPCERLEKVFATDPSAKIRLDAIRIKL
jgi:hypothetical protein